LHPAALGCPLLCEKIPYLGGNNTPTNSLSVSKVASLGNTGTFSGAILLPNGTIVYVPFSAEFVGMFDPSTNCFSHGAGTVMSNKGNDAKYFGGVLAPNGNVYFVPHNADNVGVFDPKTGSFTQIKIAKMTAPTAQYTGGILAPNRKIYFIPHHANNIGVVDPSTNVFRTILIKASGKSGKSGKFSKSLSKYSGGVLHGDGKIYFIPSKACEVGVFDPNKEAFKLIPIKIPCKFNKYAGGVLRGDGRIYFIPREISNFGIFNPVGDGGTFQTVSILPKAVAGRLKYSGSVMSPDKKTIYLVPEDSDNIGVIDTIKNSFSTIPLPETDFQGHYYQKNQVTKYRGGVLAKNGKIYFTPSSHRSIGSLTPPSDEHKPGVLFPGNYL